MATHYIVNEIQVKVQACQNPVRTHAFICARFFTTNNNAELQMYSFLYTVTTHVCGRMYHLNDW